MQDDIQPEDYYIDINASGTNYNRCEFQWMLQDIADGKIHCVIVKDLSRFGREHIDVGFWLEKYFPVRVSDLSPLMKIGIVLAEYMTTKKIGGILHLI